MLSPSRYPLLLTKLPGARISLLHVRRDKTACSHHRCKQLIIKHVKKILLERSPPTYKLDVVSCLNNTSNIVNLMDELTEWRQPLKSEKLQHLKHKCQISHDHCQVLSNKLYHKHTRSQKEFPLLVSTCIFFWSNQFCFQMLLHGCAFLQECVLWARMLLANVKHWTDRNQWSFETACVYLCMCSFEKMRRNNQGSTFLPLTSLKGVCMRTPVLISCSFFRNTRCSYKNKSSLFLIRIIFVQYISVQNIYFFKQKCKCDCNEVTI